MSHVLSLYAFEAKSLQSYILSGGRLRDIVATSGLIDGLCRWPAGESGPPDLLDHVLGSMGADARVIGFVRRAAGGLIAVSESTFLLRKFREIWTLSVQMHAPGLDFADAIVEGKEGDSLVSLMANLPLALRASRNRLNVRHPVPTAFVRRAPRTGGAAVEVEPMGGQETLDHSLQRKRWFADSNLSSDVGRKFCGVEVSYRWPTNMEPTSDARPGEHFPLLAGNKYIGLLHADGNGMGQVIIDLSKKLSSFDADFGQRALKAFSRAIESATKGAARDATQTHLVAIAQQCGTFPARPILLAGDDLTVILRGDVALPFATCFLKKFEEHSAAQLKAFLAEFGELRECLPSSLTAGAGLAFARASVPFSEILHLTEGLARFAKSRAKLKRLAHGSAPSSIAFFRLTGGRVGDFAGEILPQELSAGIGGEVLSLTAGPFGLDSDSGLQHIDSVTNIASVIVSSEGLGAKRAFKEMASLIQSQPELAVRRYQRWREVAKSADPQSLTLFDSWLDASGSAKLGLPVLKGERDGWVTPIFDALTLISVAGESASMTSRVEEDGVD